MEQEGPNVLFLHLKVLVAINFQQASFYHGLSIQPIFLWVWNVMTAPPAIARLKSCWNLGLAHNSVLKYARQIKLLNFSRCEFLQPKFCINDVCGLSFYYIIQPPTSFFTPPFLEKSHVVVRRKVTRFYNLTVMIYVYMNAPMTVKESSHCTLVAKFRNHFFVVF